MADVEDKCLENGGDPAACAILQQVADDFDMEWRSEIDRRTLPKVAARYMELSARDYRGENLHPGGSIYYSQFVKSVLEYW